MKVATNTAKLLRNVPLPDEIATVHDNAVIIDLGTGSTRIGFSGDDAPRMIAPTVTAYGGSGATKLEEPLCLNEAYKNRESIPFKRVMEGGAVTDWDGFEVLMRYIYCKLLGLDKDEHAPMLLTEAALVNKQQRERMVEILFESIGVSALYFSVAPVLSLYSTGRTTGTVVEMGYGTCHTVPVFEGFGLYHSILQLDFGGQDLTDMVQGYIKQRGVSLSSHHATEISQFVKETYSIVQPDSSSYTIAVGEANKSDQIAHVLPDGTQIVLGNERYKPSEALFDPSILERGDLKGIHHLAVESVRKCDQDTVGTLLGNVVLSGGTSLFKGLSERINKEMQSLEQKERVRVHAPPERRNAAWVGGSIFASLPTVQDFWVQKQDYDNDGGDGGKADKKVRSAIAHKNCF